MSPIVIETKSAYNALSLWWRNDSCYVSPCIIIIALMLLQWSGDKSSWIGGAYMFRLMRRREQNDPQYPSHNPTHCMTFAVWESIWKCKPLSLFNKHVHLMYFDPLGSIVPAGEFDLSVACNFFSCEISILYWHLVGLSASSWWHSFLCVLSHPFCIFWYLIFRRSDSN